MGLRTADAILNEPLDGISWEAAAASDRGRRRAGNEDCFLYRVAPAGQVGIFTVCDGMGGAAGGEIASRLAAETLVRSMNSSIDPPMDPGETSGRDLEERLLAAALEANRQVHWRSRQQSGLAGMGTTLVALAVRGSAGRLVHVGDSRCYRLRAGVLEQLTQDHSLVEEQVRAGQITRRQAERSPLSHVLTRAVGTAETVQVELSRLSVGAGDLYLLCSDGLTRELTEERLTAILCAAEALGPACAELIEAANLLGGRDNVTCLLARALRTGGGAKAKPVSEQGLPRRPERANPNSSGRENGRP